jgi:hypothetical protein
MSITKLVRGLFPSTKGRPKLTNYANEQFELQAQLDDLNTKINDPLNNDDVGELIRERDVVLAKLKAVAARQAVATDQEYRASLEKRSDRFRAELDAELSALRSIMPRLRFHLAGLQLLEDRLEEEGSGRSWEQVTAGLKFGSASRLLVAIAREIDESTVWGDVWAPSAVAKLLDAGREYSRKKAAERAEAEAAAEAEFQRRLEAFERGESREDPRIVTYRVRAGR